MQKAFDYMRHNPGIVIITVMAILLGWNTFQVILKNYEFQQRVDELNDEIAVLELENQKLKYNIEYYKTDAYLEQRARESLNLKEQGEEVVIVQRRKPSDLTDTKPEKKQNTVQRLQSNLIEWYELLTGQAQLNQ